MKKQAKVKKPTYKEWIQTYVDLQPNQFVRGKCAEATAQMVEVFPELKRVSGFVHCSWGRDQHWWCVTPDGKIIDPTVSQFAVVFHYEVLDLTDPDDQARVPTGTCLDCGADVYQCKTFCDERCEQSTRAYMSI